jgi:hypothetical protein
LFLACAVVSSALRKSDFLSDDDHNVTTGSAFIEDLSQKWCHAHFLFFSSLGSQVSFFKSES